MSARPWSVTATFVTFSAGEGMDRKECLRFIQKNIPDEDVRRFVFCGDEDDDDLFLNNRNDMLKYYSSMMNLAFSYVYGHYRIWRDAGGTIDEINNTNFRRAINTFDELYRIYDLTFELIESTLLDIQLDEALGQELKKELRISGIGLNRDFSKCAYKARKYRRTSRITDDMDISEQRDELINFLRSFPFLRDLRLDLVKVDNVSKAPSKEGEVAPYNKMYNVNLIYENDFAQSSESYLDTHGQLVSIGGEFFYLDRIDVRDESDGVNTKSLLLNYTSVGEYDRAKMVIIENQDNGRNNEILTIRGENATEMYYLDLFPGDMTLEEGSRSLKDMHSINYKYVKNLSLAVSDVISEDGKIALISTYGEIHPDIFVRTGKAAGTKGYNWDNVIGMLLIRENANNILKTIFKHDIDCYQKLLYNLEVRFGPERVNAKALISIIARKQEDSVINWEALFNRGNQPMSSVKMSGNILASKSEIAACEIISVLSKVANDSIARKEESYNFPIDMKGRIDFLDDLSKSSLGLATKITTLESIVQHTLRGIVCFYEGLFEYCEVKRSFDDESYYRCLSDDTVKEYRDETERAFKQKVQETISSLSNPDYSTITGILSRIEMLCKKCITDTGEQTHYGKLLKDVIGRSQILDFNELQVLDQCLDNIRTEGDLENAIEIVTGVFKYLSNGKVRGTNVNAKYPYIGTYEYTNYGKDGFNVARFTITTERKQMDVEVLSEFTYRIGDRYFCLPNILRSNDSLWIDPVIIKLADFDMNIMRGELND